MVTGGLKFCRSDVSCLVAGFAFILFGGEVGLGFVMTRGQGWREGYREAEEKKVIKDKIKSEISSESIQRK